MRSIACLLRPALPAQLLALCSLPGLLAQGSGALTLGQIDPASAKPGATFTERIPLHLKAGFHCNSNAPNDDYLIPLKLTWVSGPVTSEEVAYPKPQLENYAFSQKPVSVFSGTFVLETRFKVKADAVPGPVTVTGKLRYQACNDKECLPPKTISVQVPVEVR